MSDDFAADKMIRQDEICARVAATITEHLGGKTDLGKNEHITNEFASRLWRNVYYQPGFYFDKNHDVAALDKIERATRMVSAALDEMTVLSEDTLTDTCGLDVLLNYLSSARALNAAATDTRRVIEKSPQSRNRVSTINEDALKVVDFARFTWRWLGASDPPSRALNPASSFGNFLADLLEAIEVDANPQAAFRAWTAHFGEG